MSGVILAIGAIGLGANGPELRHRLRVGHADHDRARAAGDGGPGPRRPGRAGRGRRRDPAGRRPGARRQRLPDLHRGAAAARRCSRCARALDDALRGRRTTSPTTRSARRSARAWPNSAVIAIIASLIVISAYIALRFEWKYAVPVLIALSHDLLITAGVYALLGEEVTTATVAALLTILGFSLYDTIIVFDRIRENVPRMPRAAFSQIVNRSMSEVLTRSLATSFCTLLPILGLFFFGGDTLRQFAIALIIGTASGTYSSVFIAGPVLTHWKEREPVWTSSPPDDPGGARRGPRRTRPSSAGRPSTSRRRSARRARRRLTAPDDPERGVSACGVRRDGARTSATRRRTLRVRVGRPLQGAGRPAGAGSRGRRSTSLRRRRRRPSTTRPTPSRRTSSCPTRSASERRQAPPQPPSREESLMAVLAWVMMGLAVWHFTIFVPDRFVGGIVGAFLAAIAGAIVFGFLVNGLSVPSRDDVDVLTALEGIPGSIIGMGIAWLVGNAREGDRARRPEFRPDASVASGGLCCPHPAWRSTPATSPRRCASSASSACPASSRRCSSAAASPIPTLRAPGWRRRIATTSRRSRASRRRRRSSGATSRTAGGSRSTATTTSTGWRRPRSSSARCASWAPTSAGSSRAAPRTATACPPRRSSASPPAARGCSSPWTAGSPRSTRSPRRARRGWTSSSPTTTALAPTACCPTRRSSTRRSRGYPCPELCGAGVAHMLARALRDDDAERPEDLELVALATVADCVPLRGENRRLVRAGLRAMGTTRSPGLRALMKVAKADPARIDARAIGFRLAPRLNAAGRLYRADAGVELLLTGEDERARAIAEELDRANAERRHVEQRILFEAEGMVAEQGERTAYVLAGEGWHPGVIGIVASRIAERHHRPCVLVALDGDAGTGSGRSIPAFDLLGGLEACARAPRPPRRAPRGGRLPGPQGGRRGVPRRVRGPRRRDAAPGGPRARRSASTPSSPATSWASTLAEELEALAPFGTANPDVALLVPAARLCDPRPMGEGRHVRFTVVSGGRRAQAVAFGVAQVDCDAPVDAMFALEVNEWGGAVAPRLVLRHAAALRAGADRGRRRAGRTSSAPRSRCSTPRRRSQARDCRRRDGPSADRRARARPPRRRHRRDRRARSCTPASRCSSSSPTPRCARGSSRRSSAACACARTTRCAPIRASPTAPTSSSSTRRRRRPRRSTCWRAKLAGRSIWPGERDELDFAMRNPRA